MLGFQDSLLGKTYSVWLFSSSTICPLVLAQVLTVKLMWSGVFKQSGLG